ncbi:TerB family tellurite resistance protein [Robiginitalea sp. IMCC43444]|uniref:TerB family tellurite resistance protein n=1 Tax=Robiginitalea sp. IMCC43444 TaxID=3459121 RepID=UPI004041098B
MKFNLIEKLAVIKAVDEVFRIDNKVTTEEIKYMDKLAKVMGFDDELLQAARDCEPAEAIAVLKTMPDPQKQTLARLLNEAANADGKVDEVEIQFIYRLFTAAGIDIRI